MAEYAFVSIPVVRQRAGFDLSEDYRQVIEERAEAGWNFVQAIPFETHVTPRVDLVFQR